MADDTKTHISLEEHTDNVEVQTSQVPSKEELQAQKSLLWKLDLVILPLLSLSYLLAYMDRNNVGYSRLMGLQKALKLSDKQFYNVVMVFSIFYSATTISGVFSGLIAYGVQKGLEGTDGRASWQWLFLIEGVIAVAVGLANAALLPNFPDRMETSRFISELETKVAWQRSQEYNAKSVRFESSQIIKSLLDPKTYLLALLAGCNSTLLAATGAFLPTIVVGFGYSKIQSQLFTIIPYACSFFSMLAVGYLSDFYRNKSWFILGSLTSCAIGLIVLISSTGKQVGMFGTSLLVAGAYPAAVLQITWIQITFCGNTKRAISWGVAMIVGQGLSMSAAQIYTTPPRFFEGHGILLGFVVMGMVCTVAARFLMARANKQTDQELREYEERGQEHPGVGKSFEEVCDNHINFRYSL